MWMVVGLGNPGMTYARTRHNVGFAVVARLGRRWDFDPQARERHGAQVARCTIAGRDCVTVMPQGFMNLSGQPVADLAGELGVEPVRIIVVHDDLDLPWAAVRCKNGGGHGGHNGLRDLHRHLGGDYLRVRVGVGRPAPGVTPADHVLGHWTADEAQGLDELIDQACDAVEVTLREGAVAAMNRFNVRAPRTDESSPTMAGAPHSIQAAAGQAGPQEP